MFIFFLNLMEEKNKELLNLRLLLNRIFILKKNPSKLKKNIMKYINGMRKNCF